MPGYRTATATRWTQHALTRAVGPIAGYAQSGRLAHQQTVAVQAQGVRPRQSPNARGLGVTGAMNRRTYGHGMIPLKVGIHAMAPGSGGRRRWTHDESEYRHHARHPPGHPRFP